MNKIFEEIAERYGTPFYLFNIDRIVSQIEKIKSAFPKFNLCYCIKANPFVVPFIVSYISRFEVCSPGEFDLCRHYSINPEKIFYTGVYKEKKEVETALRYGVRNFSCESMEQLRIIVKAAESVSEEVFVYLRYGDSNQFGLDEETLLEIIENLCVYKVNFAGIHYFEKSQKKSTNKISTELQEIDRLCDMIQEKYSFKVLNIEYGLGLDVDYFSFNPEEKMTQLLAEASDVLKSWNREACITIEMGRFFAAPCGYYITKVVDTKTKGNIQFAILDGGSHQMHYDGQMLGMKTPIIRNLGYRNNKSDSWTLCGSLCTHNDIIARNVTVYDLKINDLLVFEYIGAYSVTEGMAMFLSRDIPPVIITSKDIGILCARKRISSYYFNIIDTDKLS